jgi:Carboxypeptidase regulatory-like domain
MTRLILIPLLLLAVFSSLGRAQESTASSCPCTLRGTVVDSVSGAPVRGALVTSSLGSPNATLTDAEGSFHFDGLPRGTVSLSAIKRGFLPPQPFLIHYTNFQVAPGAPPAVIKLTPSAVITGRFVDDRGDPMENFRIELLRRAPGEGKRRPPLDRLDEAMKHLIEEGRSNGF